MLNEETKTKALGRLRRIEGQVQGLQRMIDGEAYCVDEASVSLATEQATVSFDPAHTSLDALQKAVAAAGYELVQPRADAGPGDAVDAERVAREADQRRQQVKFVVGAVLSAPVLLGGMSHVLPWVPAVLRNPWLLLSLTTPVQFWVGWQFHRGFLHDLRYRTASMSTLVSIGTNAAYFFSVAVTLWPHVFPAHRAMMYYDVSAVVLTLVVLGRWRGSSSSSPRRRARARRSSGWPIAWPRSSFRSSWGSPR